ncbi:MAG: SulP family inorganic anion transporter [Cyanobacteria bacterium J06632_22]
MALLFAVLSGIIIGGVGVMFSLTFASMIFQGPLQSFLAAGISIVLVSGIVMRLVVRGCSSTPLIIMDVEPLPTALLALSAGTLARQLSPTATPDAIFATVLIVMVILTLLTGLGLWLLGHFKLGKIIRYMPWPVFGGFLAATGGLLLKAGLEVMLVTPVSGETGLSFWLLHAFPGVALGVLLIGLTRPTHPPWWMPTALAGSLGLFYGAIWLSQTPLTLVLNRSWLLGPFPHQGLSWQPWHLLSLSQVDWSVVPMQLPQAGALLLVCAIAILLNASALEVILDKEIELNQELKAAGIGNFASGLAGGIVGHQVLSDTTLAYQLTRENRWTTLIAVGVFGYVLMLGPQILSLCPRFILGGLLISLGASRLYKWLIQSRAQISKIDYALLVGIMLTIMIWGLLPGIGAGLTAAIAIFVVQSSQTSGLKYVLSGSHYLSKVERSPQQAQLLKQRGERLDIWVLQGFIFFGTAHQLLTRAKERLSDEQRPKLNGILLDFRRVKGLDSSAVLSLRKLQQLAQAHSFVLIWTHLTPTLEKPLYQGQCLEKQDPLCQVFPDLDRGLQWYEEEALKESRWRRQRVVPMSLQLNHQFEQPTDTETFLDYLELLDFSAGDLLFNQGDNARYVYLIESGQVTLFRPLLSGQDQRVQTIRRGNPVGEIAFFQQSTYPTRAVIDEISTLYRLSYENWLQMSQSHPTVAAQFQTWIIRRLSLQLTTAYQEIGDLLK